MDVNVIPTRLNIQTCPSIEIVCPLEFCKQTDKHTIQYITMVTQGKCFRLLGIYRMCHFMSQGYAYKVLPMSVFPMENEKLHYDDEERQREMLANILGTDDKFWDIEEDDVLLNDRYNQHVYVWVGMCALSVLITWFYVLCVAKCVAKVY